MYKSLIVFALQPARVGGEDARVHRAVRLVCAGEIAAAHQENAAPKILWKPADFLF